MLLKLRAQSESPGQRGSHPSPGPSLPPRSRPLCPPLALQVLGTHSSIQGALLSVVTQHLSHALSVRISFLAGPRLVVCTSRNRATVQNFRIGWDPSMKCVRCRTPWDNSICKLQINVLVLLVFIFISGFCLSRTEAGQPCLTQDSMGSAALRRGENQVVSSQTHILLGTHRPGSPAARPQPARTLHSK